MKSHLFIRINSPVCRQTYTRQHHLTSHYPCHSQKVLQNQGYVGYCPTINSDAIRMKGRCLTNISSSVRYNNTTFNEVRLQMENDLRSKQKRNTLPEQLFKEIQTSIHHISIPSASTIPKSPRISFTYNPAHHQESTKNSLTSLTPYLLCSTKLKKLSRQEKQMRNKLSNQFQFYFHPEPVEIKEQIQKIDSIEHSMNSSLSNVSNEQVYLVSNLKNSKVNCSKVASTQATQSIVVDQKNNNLAFPQYFTQSTQSNRKQSSEGLIKQNHLFGNHSLNLLGRIASSKRLDKTIILSNNNGEYDFGGILHDGPSRQNSIVQQRKKQIDLNVKEMKERKWKSNVKCLLTDQSSQDLKESIHYGPDILLDRFKCELLDHFGRDIKESFMPFE